MVEKDVEPTVEMFHLLCEQIRSTTKPTIKSEMIRGFLARYKGDAEQLFCFLLPKDAGRLYHMQDKSLVKVLSQVLGSSENTLKTDLQQTGCIAVTANKFYNNAPANSNMTLQTLEEHLEALSKASGEAGQKAAIQGFIRAGASRRDLFVYLRQVKQDLRLGAGRACVLQGLHDQASTIFKTCANLRLVVRRVVAGGDLNAPAALGEDGDDEDDAAGAGAAGKNKKKPAGLTDICVGTPINPMLAAPSKGCTQVMKKCPNGAYSETKYDGERIQIHKKGNVFNYYSRNLKALKSDKVEELEDFIHAAVVADECVLDGEILMIDKLEKKPLPFGTLGKHKRAGNTDANTCIFLFDIIYLNGESLTKMPFRDRRKVLTRVVTPIDCRVLFSEIREIFGTEEERIRLLTAHLAHAILTGLEGLVVKDCLSQYEPGARHWIKLKKDYLDGCADTADFVVLGGWYGQGAKGGKLNTWLMGVLDKSRAPNANGRWLTVTKVSGGIDDAKMDELNEWFSEASGRIRKVKSRADVPAWLAVDNAHIPDVVVTDPEQSQVWEIMATEWTKTKRHTANGTSMRFPRVKRIRDDKDPQTATSLQELEAIVATSKNEMQAEALGASDDDDMDDGAVAGRAGGAMRGPDPVQIEDAKKRQEEVAAKGGMGRVADIIGQPDAAADVVPAPAARAGGAAGRGGKAMQQQQRQQQGRGGASPNQRQYQQQQRPQQQQHQQQRPTGGRTVAVRGGFHVHFSDVTRPIANLKDAKNRNMLIVHCVALSGKWQKDRGVMGAITRNLGDDCEDAYTDTVGRAQPGDVVFLEVTEPGSGATDSLHVGSMYVMRATGGHSVDLVPGALATSLVKVKRYAAKNGCQVHFAVPDYRGVSDWDAVAAALRTEFPTPGDITLYARGDPSFGHPLQAKIHAAQQDGAVTTAPAASSRRPAAVMERNFTADRGAQDFMRGLNVGVLVGSKDAAQYKNTLVMLGAKVIDLSVVAYNPQAPIQVPAECTHVLRPNVQGPQVVQFNKKPDQIVVATKWVDECFAKNRLLPNTQEEMFFGEQQQQDGAAASVGEEEEEFPLQDCKIVFDRAALGNATVDQLLPIVTRLGATVQPKMRTIGSERTTHFISTQELTPAARQAMDTDCAAVTPRWVHECVRRRVECDPGPFVCGTDQFNAANGGDDDDSAVVGPRRLGSEFAATTGSFVFNDDRSRRIQEQQQQQQPPRAAGGAATLRRERTPDFTDVFAQVNQRDALLRKSSGRNADNKIFDGVTAFFSGYPPQTHSALTDAFTALGGRVLPAKPTASTPNSVFIIADTLTTDVVSALDGPLAQVPSPSSSPSKVVAPALKRMVVSRCWIDESVASRKKMALDRYLYRSSGGNNQPFVAECCAEKFLDNVALGESQQVPADEDDLDDVNDQFVLSDDDDDFGALASNDGSAYGGDDDKEDDKEDLQDTESDGTMSYTDGMEQLLGEDDDGAMNGGNSNISHRSVSSAGPLEKFRVAIAARDEAARQNLETQVLSMGGTVADFAQVTAGASNSAGAATGATMAETQQLLASTPSSKGARRDEGLVVIALTDVIAAEARSRQLRLATSNPWRSALVVTSSWLWDCVSSKTAAPPENYEHEQL